MEQEDFLAILKSLEKEYSKIYDDDDDKITHKISQYLFEKYQSGDIKHFHSILVRLIESNYKKNGLWYCSIFFHLFKGNSIEDFKKLYWLSLEINIKREIVKYLFKLNCNNVDICDDLFAMDIYNLYLATLWINFEFDKAKNYLLNFIKSEHFDLGTFLIYFNNNVAHESEIRVKFKDVLKAHQALPNVKNLFNVLR